MPHMVSLPHKTAVPYSVQAEVVAAEMSDVTRTKAERRRHNWSLAAVWWYLNLTGRGLVFSSSPASDSSERSEGLGYDSHALVTI